jgi:hypothetical protein
MLPRASCIRRPKAAPPFDGWGTTGVAGCQEARAATQRTRVAPAHAAAAEETLHKHVSHARLELRLVQTVNYTGGFQQVSVHEDRSCSQGPIQQSTCVGPTRAATRSATRQTWTPDGINAIACPSTSTSPAGDRQAVANTTRLPLTRSTVTRARTASPACAASRTSTCARTVDTHVWWPAVLLLQATLHYSGQVCSEPLRTADAAGSPAL